MAFRRQMDGVLEAVCVAARDVPVPVTVHRLREHVALLFHLLEQIEQGRVPAAPPGFLGDKKICVHHLHPEADAEHGLAAFRGVFHDLKMIGVKACAAAENECLAQRQRLRNDVSVAAEKPDRRAAVCADALGVGVDEQIMVCVHVLRGKQLCARYDSNNSHLYLLFARPAPAPLIFELKTDPACCPDRSPPGRGAGIPVLSDKKAEIPGSERCQARAPRS